MLILIVVVGGIIVTLFVVMLRGALLLGLAGLSGVVIVDVVCC